MTDAVNVLERVEAFVLLDAMLSEIVEAVDEALQARAVTGAVGDEFDKFFLACAAYLVASINAGDGLVMEVVHDEPQQRQA